MLLRVSGGLVMGEAGGVIERVKGLLILFRRDRTILVKLIQIDFLFESLVQKLSWNYTQLSFLETYWVQSKVVSLFVFSQ